MLTVLLLPMSTFNDQTLVWWELWNNWDSHWLLVSKIERVKKGNDCRLRKGSNSPAPPNCTNFHPFFYPTFFFCNLILIIWNEFYTWSHSKLLFLSPLIIGSKLTFSGWSDRWLPYSVLLRVTSTTIHIWYKAQTCFGSKGVIQLK